MIELQDFFSTAGTITAFALSLSPSVPFYKVLSGQEKKDILPEGMILFLMLTRLVWASVWIITKRKMALLNSSLGVTVSNVFITLYFYVYFQRSCLKAFFSLIILLCIEAGLLYSWILWGDYLTLSYIAMSCKIIMSISPGQKIIRVIKEKNYKLIPITSAITNFFCSLSWLCYGICIKLYGQIISNLIGLIFSILNSIIWFYYYMKRDKDSENNEKEKDLDKEKNNKDEELELIEK
jgi:uncharacterized protein with PQ loop repeat